MIDWAPLLKYPPSECECACGAVYYSRAKCIRVGDKLTHATQYPCPACDQSEGNCSRISSEPERMVIGPEDVGTAD